MANLFDLPMVYTQRYSRTRIHRRPLYVLCTVPAYKYLAMSLVSEVVQCLTTYDIILSSLVGTFLDGFLCPIR